MFSKEACHFFAGGACLATAPARSCVLLSVVGSSGSSFSGASARVIAALRTIRICHSFRRENITPSVLLSSLDLRLPCFEYTKWMDRPQELGIADAKVDKSAFPWAAGWVSDCTVRQMENREFCPGTVAHRSCLTDAFKCSTVQEPEDSAQRTGKLGPYCGSTVSPCWRSGHWDRWLFLYFLVCNVLSKHRS